ncbi:MAG: beta-N-acetylhexosaminidase [Maribacter sp.]|nr:beta-N-acetylhexosaminidase [Maribacter sp.]
MRQPLTILILVLITYGCVEKNRTFSSSEVSIIPRPNELVLGEESFAFKNNLSVYVENPAQKSAGEYLVNLLRNTANINLVINDSDEKASIVFAKDEDLQPEAYKLNITPRQVLVQANSPSGYFYAVQSIQQLMIEDQSTSRTKWVLPTSSINDAPLFGWRAYMLDEARYFQGEEFVKSILDQMALLKMNVFHWHLTDDGGWRMEIKKYPKLTEIGSHRADSEIETWKSGKTSGEAHGGYYTQEQIKNIVAYAAERHITIVPEFEMPGHASAAIAAYTWLGTAGIDIDVPITFGRHYDNYDVTKPEVVQFVKDVLTEMFELFPSKVIHIGGDEVGYKVWEESNHVRKHMKDSGLNTPADLQIAFTNEISKFIEKNGRRMMGWNEIMGINIHQGFEEKKDDKEAETELAKNVVVHFWKGNLELATAAAQKGYGIVNSLHSETYLDYSYEAIDLEKAYNFKPIPDGLEAKFHKNIYGLGCQMWTEWTPTNKDVSYQTFPRIAAYAEVGWTNPENKDFDTFSIALNKLQRHWDVVGIQYVSDLNNPSNEKGTSH